MAAPRISVVIASHDGGETLCRCLRALAEQQQDPSTFEVVIGDGGSSDGGIETIEALEAPYRLRVLRLPKQGRSATRNAAIEAAESPICLCIDDTIVAWPTLVSGHLQAHLSGPTIVGLGRIVQQPPARRDWYAHAFAGAWNDRHEQLAATPEPSWTEFHDGNFSARRELLLAASDHTTDAPTGAGRETGLGLRQHGGVLAYLPEAGGVRADQRPGRQLVAESRRQGAGWVELAGRRPEAMPILLGRFSEPGQREVLLRRMLLSLRVPPSGLRLLGRLLPGRGRRQAWMCLISRYGFWRGVRGAVSRERWLQLSRRTPVLMYHGFGEERSRYVVRRRAFRRQVLALRLLRYRAITFGELAAARREHRFPPPRSLVITIDDGYADNLELAAPVLARHGFPATLFLVSRRLGAANDWDSEPPAGGRPLMSARQAAEMRKRGHELGAHTRTHCSLTDAGDEEVREQVGGSRRDLEAELGVEVSSFAYPYGRHNRRAVDAVAEAGFTGACTTSPALARLDDDPLLIPRIEIKGSDSIASFLRKLWLGR